jgi:endonuclease/exonuclease/phosphatase family metal-dependent hydrolase
VFTKIFPAFDVKHFFDVAERKDDISSMHGNPVVDERGFYHGNMPTEKYIRSLDHILGYGDGYVVKDFKVVLDQNALDASDHSPVYADVELL